MRAIPVAIEKAIVRLNEIQREPPNAALCMTLFLSR
jgi:hypothetical protein